MADCRACKARFRADDLIGVELIFHKVPEGSKRSFLICGVGTPEEVLETNTRKIQKLERANGPFERLSPHHVFNELNEEGRAEFICPNCGEKGHLTEPRDFNLMFETYIGAVRDEENKSYLRPETAQGIFLNYKNVLDTMRVKVPFGIAQIGKAFRNEVTPRNYIYRSREFEQMEMEWFCRPEEASTWFDYWQRQRLDWWRSTGLSDENLRIRPHGADELSHYAKGGAGTVDIEYRFPFTHPDFAELEGIAHRTDFDLKAHQQHARLKLEYFDQERNTRYIPHVVEPAAGLTRGALALLCEAYTPDPGRPSKVFLRFHPRLAPIQAAVFPLVAKGGMPEVAERLYRELRCRYACQFDVKQNIGKRYARMDEAGTPYCFTIDGQTLEDRTVTVRHRDDTRQERIGIDGVGGFLAERIEG
jgi:glycyl-tRNA synthetase